MKINGILGKGSDINVINLDTEQITESGVEEALDDSNSNEFN